MDINSFDGGVVAILILFSQLIGKFIPDDAAGVLGIARRIFKILGLYVENKKGDDTPL